MNYAEAMRAVIRVPVVCLTVLALSIIGYALGLYSLVVVTMAVVAFVIAMPTWSSTITARTWSCPHCAHLLPTTFRFALVLPADTPICPHCETPLTP